MDLNIIENLRHRLKFLDRRMLDEVRSPDRTDIEGTINDALAQAGLIAPRASSEVPARRRAGTSPARSSNRADSPATQRFVARSFSNPAGTRAYKLYVPSSYSIDAAAMPLLVMLHGCTQSPDDFAAATRMNELAEIHGFLVAYPEQAARANGSRCWNWFLPTDQVRDKGEPSLIAGITREIVASYRIDGRRVFVAGLSAGAAMAIILGTTYPELYAGVGAHSGLPLGAAHDVASAFQVMRVPTGVAPPAARRNGAAPRTIIFHGDQDSTVALGNGLAIAAEASRAATGDAPLRTISVEGRTASGAAYTRSCYLDSADVARVELWVLHGANHAWAGGSAAGTFTDPAGVDASGEMLRFFGMLRAHAS